MKAENCSDFDAFLYIIMYFSWFYKPNESRHVLTLSFESALFVVLPLSVWPLSVRPPVCPIHL